MCARVRMCIRMVHEELSKESETQVERVAKSGKRTVVHRDTDTQRKRERERENERKREKRVTL